MDVGVCMSAIFVRTSTMACTLTPALALTMSTGAGVERIGADTSLATGTLRIVLALPILPTVLALPIPLAPTLKSMFWVVFGPWSPSAGENGVDGKARQGAVS
jgi:hypothetical protein